MSLIVKNTSNKVIGFGEVDILPGEAKAIPDGYDNNPTLSLYEKHGDISVTKPVAKATKVAKANVPASKASEKESLEAEKKAAAEKTASEKASKETEEAEKKADLKVLKGKPSTEEIAALAVKYGINPAECMTSNDIVKKLVEVLS